MAYKAVFCLVIITTLTVNANVLKVNYDKHTCGTCSDHNTDKVETDNETTDPAKSDETASRISRKIDTDGGALAANNLITNATQILEPNANKKTEVKPTDANKKVSEKEEIDTASSQVYNSYSPSTYEVHENIIDVPDDRKPVGPIVASYTKPPILNTVTPSSNSVTNTDKVTPANIKDRKHLVNILHIKVEDDENVKEEHKVSGIFKGIKEYFSGLQKGLLNSIHHIFYDKNEHKHKYKRSTNGQQSRNEQRDKQNSNNVDKTEYFVHKQHISLT